MNGRMTSFYPEGCGVGYIYKGSTNTDADMAQKSDDQMTVISSINLFPYYLLFSILRVCLSIKCLWMGIMFLYIYINLLFNVIQCINFLSLPCHHWTIDVFIRYFRHVLSTTRPVTQ